MTNFAEIKMHHATRAKAERLMETLAAEYGRVTLVAIAGDEIDHETFTHELGHFAVVYSEIAERTNDLDEESVQTILETEKVPALADVLDACAEMGIDPTSEEEEAGPSGSVVGEAYRARYRESSSNGQTCGDWLAERLTADCHGVDGFMIEDFKAVLANNEIDQSGKWARLPESGQKGWVGRWRMSGRIALEKQIAFTGVYVDPTGQKCTPHADWLAEARAKHAKWIAKEEKRIAEAKELMK